MKAVQVLAGVAILLVMTATAGAEVYFPHVDTTDGWQTEIAVINTGDAAVTGTLKAYSDEGRVVETKTVMLAGRGRKQVSVASEFTSSGIGYLVLETSASSVVGYTKFYRQGQYGNYRVAVPAIREINTADMYVTHIDSGTQWWTGLSLVNTTGQAKTLTITFQTGETRTVTLEAYAHRAFTIASLFADQPRPDIRSAAITNANGIIGLELFATHDGKLMEGIVLTDKTATTLYYPHVAGSGWWTGVVAYNPSAQAGTITVTPYSAAGTALTVSTLSLPGKQNYVGAVFSDLVLPAQTAWFRIDSTVPLSGFELIGSDDFEQLAGCADVGSLGAKAGIFAKLEKSGWTGIALVNTEAAAASVTLTAYSDDGTVVATQVQSVGSHAKVVNSAEGFFSRSIATATYLAFTSDRNVVGLQFNGSVDWTLLDGLPALGATTATAASFPGTILLGAPTASSIRVNVLSPDQTGTVSVAYGTAPGRYGGQTEPAALLAGKPLELAIGGLAADTRYYYRPYFQASGDTAPAPTEEYTFHTARANGSTFTFTVQADSHLDENSDLELYRRTLANVLADAPDFHVDLGDTFMCEKKSAPLTAANQTARDQPTVDARYAYERTHFGIVTHSVPLFLANGNHEGESGTLADGTAQNLAVWATQARQRYLCEPPAGRVLRRRHGGGALRRQARRLVCLAMGGRPLRGARPLLEHHREKRHRRLGLHARRAAVPVARGDPRRKPGDLQVRLHPQSRRRARRPDPRRGGGGAVLRVGRPQPGWNAGVRPEAAGLGSSDPRTARPLWSDRSLSWP